MRKNIEFLIKMVIYLTFLTPLIFIPSNFIFPFIVPKIIFFRIVVEIMLGAYVLLLITNWQAYKPKMTPITIGVILFYIVSFGASTFFGVDAYHSFWDNHERMLGFFTIIHYVIFYFVCSQFIKDWTGWKWALRLFLFAGSIVTFIGLLQVSILPNLLMNNGGDRVYSTLGNPIYLGGYGLFLAFVAVLLMIKDKSKIWQFIYSLFFVFSVLALFYSGTRGAVLGLLAGAGVSVVVYVIVLKKSSKIRYVLFGLILLGIIGIGILYANRQTDFVKNIPSVGRAINTSWEDIKATPRWIAWEISWESFTERPVFGWGPNNYFYAFNDHYNPRSLDYGYGETWFDNAHNMVMNTLAVQGAVGILTYIALFIISIYVLIRAYIQKRVDMHILALGSGFLIAHFVGIITVFENITSYIYFMFWLAMINSLASGKKEAVGNISYKKIGTGVIAVVAITIALIIFIFNIQPARANKGALGVLRLVNSNPAASIDKINEAFAFSSPHIDDIRSDITRNVSNIIMNNFDKMDKKLAMELINLVENELVKNTILHPLEIRTLLSMTQIYQIKATIENEKSKIYLNKAKEYLEKALEISPNRQQLMYTLASLNLNLGNKQEAIELFEQAIDDNSKIGESYWRLAYVYSATGEPEKVKEILLLAKQNNAVMTPADQTSLEKLFPEEAGAFKE